MNNKSKYELEEDIRELIYDDNKNSVHFEYCKVNVPETAATESYEEFTVKVITRNKRTGAEFLLKSSIALNPINALEKVYDNLVNNSDYHTFTIKWYYKGRPAERPFKSKFMAKDIINAINKFYHGENKNSLVIYSISDDNIKSKDYEG